MSAIIVKGLSKRYVLGHESKADTLRDALTQGVSGWWSRLRHGPLEEEEFWALRDVSFRVEPGEVVGIVGRNGAGKSTLLKILSRITEPTAGSVRLRGRVASLLEVGTGFHPELTGRENIFLNGAILGMQRAEIRRKFDEIVAFAEIDRFLDTPVKRYSSGMYVRLAFAVAAHLEPEILIVDEVLAVGDAQFQQKCLGKMQAIAADQGRTILFVSHNLKAVEHLCSRGLLLERGRIVMNDTAHKVVADYLHRVAAQPRANVARALNDELDLTGLSFAPATGRTRESLEFNLSFKTKRDCVLQDLHLFFYNAFGERAMILDLRDPAVPGGLRPVPAGRQLHITGRIARLMLVEGNYRVGFTLRTARHFETCNDLADLPITAPPSQGGLQPYAPEYQGTVLLDHEFTARID